MAVFMLEYERLAFIHCLPGLKTATTVIAFQELGRTKGKDNKLLACNFLTD